METCSHFGCCQGTSDKYEVFIKDFRSLFMMFLTDLSSAHPFKWTVDSKSS